MGPEVQVVLPGQQENKGPTLTTFGQVGQVGLAG
jgi:hypothetical protein